MSLYFPNKLTLEAELYIINRILNQLLPKGRDMRTTARTTAKTSLRSTGTARTTLKTDEEEESIALFNVWAFIFSVLYFFYKGLAGPFLLFMVLPFVLSLLFMFVAPFEVAFLVGVALSHFAAGLSANVLLSRQKIDLSVGLDGINPIKPNQETEYFAISLPRLIICSILSGGLYSVYWSFKNWDNYQKATNDRVISFFRCLYFNLTAVSLFDTIKITTKDKRSFTFNGVCCGLIFVATLFLYYLVFNGVVSEKQSIAAISLLTILTIIYPFCIVPVQASVNRYTTQKLRKPLEKRFHFFEVVIIVLGLANFWGNIPFQAVNNSVFTDEEAEKVGASIGFLYRNFDVLPQVCEQEGYNMQYYPQDLSDFLDKDINHLTHALAQRGYTLKRARDEIITPEIMSAAKVAVYKELEQLRQKIILNRIAKEQHVAPESLTWKDEYASELTYGEVCEFYDENGIDIVRNGKSKDFLKNNAIDLIYVPKDKSSQVNASAQ